MRRKKTLQAQLREYIKYLEKAEDGEKEEIDTDGVVLAGLKATLAVLEPEGEHATLEVMTDFILKYVALMRLRLKK